jgi:hypothetical protein
MRDKAPKDTVAKFDNLAAKGQGEDGVGQFVKENANWNGQEKGGLSGKTLGLGCEIRPPDSGPILDDSCSDLQAAKSVEDSEDVEEVSQHDFIFLQPESTGHHGNRMSQCCTK